jgi:hypothetical protein
MKNIFWTLCIALSVSFLHWNNAVASAPAPAAAAAPAAAETKKVCVEQKDTKTGKMKEVCKQVKQHKKLEGTKVPEKK